VVQRALLERSIRRFGQGWWCRNACSIHKAKQDVSKCSQGLCYELPQGTDLYDGHWMPFTISNLLFRTSRRAIHPPTCITSLVHQPSPFLTPSPPFHSSTLSPTSLHPTHHVSSRQRLPARPNHVPTVAKPCLIRSSAPTPHSSAEKHPSFPETRVSEQEHQGGPPLQHAGVGDRDPTSVCRKEGS
jgi:hypothetical protein